MLSNNMKIRSDSITGRALEIELTIDYSSEDEGQTKQ